MFSLLRSSLFSLSHQNNKISQIFPYQNIIQLISAQQRNVSSRSPRNVSTRLIGKHQEPRTEEQRLRMRNKHKPFVLGRDNVKRDFEPIKFSDEALSIRKENVQYEVLRTENGALPVYTDYKNGRSRFLTKIRRISGDVKSLANDLGKFLPKENIEVKQPMNHIIIKGNVDREVRYWLTAIGF